MRIGSAHTRASSCSARAIASTRCDLLHAGGEPLDAIQGGRAAAVESALIERGRDYERIDYAFRHQSPASGIQDRGRSFSDVEAPTRVGIRPGTSGRGALQRTSNLRETGCYGQMHGRTAGQHSPPGRVCYHAAYLRSDSSADARAASGHPEARPLAQPACPRAQLGSHRIRPGCGRSDSGFSHLVWGLGK